MSKPYLFDNAVLDRHAKLANGLAVEGEFEFADRLWLLARSPASDVEGDDRLLDSFLDRKHVYAPVRSETGGIGLGVLFIVVCAGAALWGWTHGSSAPNGATVLGVLIIAVGVLIIGTFGHFYRRSEQRGQAHTKRMESGMQQDTTGDHIWDA